MRSVHVLAGAALSFALLGFSSPANAQVDKKIERLWKAKCASCHGAAGEASATEQGKKMKLKDYTDAAFVKSLTDEKMKEAILKGVKREADGVKKEMDGYPDLKPEQVDGLIAMIRSFAK